MHQMQYTAVRCTDKLGIKLKLKIPRLMLKNLNTNIFSHSAHFYSAYIIIDLRRVKMEGKRQTKKKLHFSQLLLQCVTISMAPACGGVCLRHMLKANKFPHGLTSASEIPTVTTTFDWLDEERKVAISLKAASITQPRPPTPQEMISMERVQNKVQGTISAPWKIQNYLKYERSAAIYRLAGCEDSIFPSCTSCTAFHGSATRGHR